MISIGTDCSGIEAPIQALKNIGIEFNHLFSSDINKFCRKSIEANYNPKIIYEDMTKKRNLPYVDIYVCGFPCQPFSLAGNMKGSCDNRGNIFFNCVDVIKQIKPKVFILENVKSIISIEKGEYFSKIKETLSKLDYNIEYCLYNTKDYGIPQNRERLFIIGVMGGKYEGIEKVKCNNILDYIDYSNENIEKFPKYVLDRYEQIKNSIFCNVNMIRIGKVVSKGDYCGTLTAKMDLWNIKLKRKATVGEMLKLQGFPEDFKQVVSNTQLKHQIGNSMSVNVLELIFKSLFRSVFKFI